MLNARTVELATLVSPMMKLLASPEPQVKKMVCAFVCRAAGYPLDG